MTTFDGMATFVGNIALGLMAISFLLRMAKRAWLEILPAIKECQNALEAAWPTGDELERAYAKKD